MTPKRVDANHAEIRDGLRVAGYVVFDTHELGGGFPDLLALSKANRLVMLEVKAPGGELNARERAFVAALPHGAPYWVVRSLDSSLAVMSEYDGPGVIA